MYKLTIILSFILLLSCTKKQTEEKIITTDYFYKIVAVDNDNTTTESWVETTKIVEIISSSNDDDDQCYCQKHREDRKCKSLPVIFESFNLRRVDKSIDVMWTASEQNLNHYRIMRSTDGATFTQVAMLFPGQGRDYRYRDKP